METAEPDSEHIGGVEDSGDIDAAPFRRWFWVIVGVALAWRIAYVLISKTNDELVGDQVYYSGQAVKIANGEWYADPFKPGVYAADHAPLTALAVAPVSWNDNDPALLQRLLMALYGAAVVAGVGLLARWVFNRRIALIATAIAAVYANFWMNDALVMSETLATGLVVAVLLAAYVYHVRRERWIAGALGVAIGLAGLARAELLLLGPLLALPLTLTSGNSTGVPARRRLAHLAIAGGAAVLVVSPWIVRNQIRFEESTTMSTQDGLALLGTNCPRAYIGSAKGFWVLDCADLVEVPPDADQSERSALYREYALDYIGDNLDLVPGVVAARLGRGLSVWKHEAMLYLNQGEGRELWASRLGLWQYWALLPIAAVGLWRWPSSQPRWPLVVAGLVAVLTIAGLYGIPRFRVAGEVGLVLCAAVAVDLLWRRLRRRQV